MVPKGPDAIVALIGHRVQQAVSSRRVDESSWREQLAYIVGHVYRCPGAGSQWLERVNGIRAVVGSTLRLQQRNGIGPFAIRLTV